MLFDIHKEGGAGRVMLEDDDDKPLCRRLMRNFTRLTRGFDPNETRATKRIKLYVALHAALRHRFPSFASWESILAARRKTNG